eukprot:6036466-Amphidinium_carterae.1
MDSDVSGRAVVWTVLDESIQCNQPLLKGVCVRFEERINVAGDTNRYGPLGIAILPYGFSTQGESLDGRGTRASPRTGGCPDVELARI